MLFTASIHLPRRSVSEELLFSGHVVLDFIRSSISLVNSPPLPLVAIFNGPTIITVTFSRTVCMVPAPSFILDATQTIFSFSLFLSMRRNFFLSVNQRREIYYPQL